MITTDYCSTEIPQLSYYKYEITTVSQEDEGTYTYTITKEKSYSTKTKKQKIPEDLEWSNSMFKNFKEWQNKILSEKKSLNVVLKQNRNHIKIRNSIKAKKAKPKKGGKC